MAKLNDLIVTGDTKMLGKLHANADSADVAEALSSSAGSLTQPIYFKDGKPVATSYALNKTVPSGAVFTDSNVTQSKTNASNWRPLLSHYINGDYNANPGTVTNTVYYNEAIAIQPSTGTLKATAFSGPLKGTADTAKQLQITSLSSNGNTYINKYRKFATAKVTNAWRSFGGVFCVYDSEAMAVCGIFRINARTGSTFDVGVPTIHWLSLNNDKYLNAIVATKDADGEFSYYLKCCNNYNTFHVLCLQVDNAVTLANGSGWVDLTASTICATSELKGLSNTAEKLRTARTISLTGDVTGSTTFDGSANASITTTATAITAGTKLNATTAAAALSATPSLKINTADNTVYNENDGLILTASWSTSYGAQIWLDDGGGEGGMAIRNRSSSAWNPWRQILTSGNFTTYLNDTYVNVTGDTMTGPIRFNYGNTTKAIFSVDDGTSGQYGFRLQYNGAESGNNNALVLIADNQEGTEVNAITMLQDGTTTFAKNITALANANINTIDTTRIYSTNGIGTDGTMLIVPQYQNEVNFGGSSNANTIYFGYRAAGSKPIPTKFVFGSSTGTATLTAAKLELTSTQDANGSAYNSPALTIGSSTGAHIEVDTNEIMAKSNASTVSTLYINNDGGLVEIGSGGLSTTGIITGNQKIHTSNDTHDIGLYLSTNRGIYDFTLSRWLIYTRVSDNTTRIPVDFYADGKIRAAGKLTVSSGGASIIGNTSITGTATISNKITLTGTEASTANIAFSRVGYNYITFPSDGNLGFATAANGDGIVVAMSSSSMYPYTTNVKTLGDSSHKWKEVYATKFIGALNGNADTATITTYIVTEAASTNSSRHVFFAYDGDPINKRRVVCSDDFKYNPSTKTLYTKRLQLYGATTATMTADSTNPGITFSESGTQPVHLIYTDYDTYRSPAGLKVIGGSSATPAWFEVEGAIFSARAVVGGYNNTSYSLSTDSFICQSWIRTTGSTGWYNESYGGGVYMTDGTYVRTYNDKAFYVSNSGQHAIYTAGGFASSNSNGAILSTYYNSTWYSSIKTHGNGNLSISPPGGSLYIAYDCGNTYFGGGTYYIDRAGYFNGKAEKANKDGDGSTITTTYAKLATYNNLIHSGNEFTFVSSAYSGTVWINYRTASGSTDGNISEYIFGNGKGGALATISSGQFSGNAATATTATKAIQDGDGNTISSTYLKLSGGTMTGSIITPKDDSKGIIPHTNNYGQIGSSDKKFYRMYATTFYGALSGNATTATTLQTARTIQTNLASTSAASFDGSANITPGITGTLGVANGGTGMTSNPSMLVNLGSTSAASVFAASPRPGVTGTLGVANGGTGRTSWGGANYPVYTSSSSALTYATSIYMGDSSIRPRSSGGASLGSTSYPWSAVHAVYFNATSDIRKKKDIYDCTFTEDILSLPIYRFKYRDYINEDEHIGCMAQDLQKICPEIVHEDEEGYLSIEENKIVYLLLDKMKRMQKEIDALKGVNNGHFWI